MIGGGVAYVGYHKLASSGAQPDEWAPASSIAYVKLDLDPAASEKIAALRFEQKFPDAPHVTSVDQLKDALLSEAFDQPSSSIDYATDIKPWLGNRVAVAAYPDASGNIQPIGILQIKDATQAQAGLTKLIHPPNVTSMSKAGFAIENDYAIVGPSQAAVDAAVAAARTSSITASNQYASDVATLGGDRIVTAWADLGEVCQVRREGRNQRTQQPERAERSWQRHRDDDPWSRPAERRTRPHQRTQGPPRGRPQPAVGIRLDQRPHHRR